MHATDKLVAKNVMMSLSAIYNPRLKKQAAEVAVVVKKALPVLRTLLDLPKDLVVRVAPIKAKSTNGRYWNVTKTCEIDCRLSWDRALEVLCHEMVHAEQYHTGRLAQVGSVHRWNGSIDHNKGSTYNAYRSMPWEQEAWARQAELAQKVNEILGA